MRCLNSKLVMNFISEQGYDPIEKTYVAYTPLDDYLCIAVAESYDNEKEENSAQLAVEAVLTAFEKRPSMKRIREYIQYANEQILLHSTRYQMKVSLTVMVTDYTRMRYGICGNTKLYVLYENLFAHVSKTQTTFQQILDDEKEEGQPDAAEIHNLTEYLGRARRVKPFLSKKIALTEDSTILLATSNLWGRLSEIEILDAYEYTKTSRDFLDILQELLLSMQDDGPQRLGSFTAAVLFIEKTYKEDTQKEKKKKRRIIIAVAAVFVILLAACIIISIIRAVDRGRMKEIRRRDQKGVQYVDYENYEKALEEYRQAVELSDRLSLDNWQYIDQKRELIETVSDRETLLMTLQEAEAAFGANEYAQAQKLYTLLKKQAVYQGFDGLAVDAGQKLDEIILRMQTAQYVTMGDMYASTEDYKQALKQYKAALELLNQFTDLGTQGDVQAKIYNIRQAQKEARLAKEEEKKAEEEARQEAEEQEKQEAVNRAVVQMNTLIANANKALGEGRIGRAKELYEKALSRYNNFTGTGEEADKVYADLTALGGAITEAEVKAEEEAAEEQLAEASKYMLQAKEAAKKGEIEKARELYDKVLNIYEKLNIWDERMEAVYEAIEGLEQTKILTGNQPDSS